MIRLSLRSAGVRQRLAGLARSNARRLSFAIALAVAAGCGTWAEAAQAPAGASVDSVASATFTIGTTAGTRVVSNAVHAQVGAQKSATLTPAAPTVGASVGAFAIAETLLNTGNATTTFYLGLVRTGSGTAALDARVVADTNGNGLVDPGEPVVTSTTPLVLAPGASIRLLVAGSLPADAGPGPTTLTLTAQADGLLAAQAVVTLVANGSASVVVSGGTPPTNASRDSDVALTVEGHSTNLPVAGIPVTVDGTPTTLVLLRGAVPANTTLTLATASAGTVTLYHRRGDPANQYVSVAPAKGDIDGVAFATTALAAGQSLTGSVTLHIASNASGTITSNTSLAYVDQGSQRNATASPVRIPLPALRSTIAFFGSDSYSRAIGSLSDQGPFYVQVDAAACNGDPDVAETLQLTMVAGVTGDSSTATLVESGPNTGIFRMTKPTSTLPGTVRRQGYLDVVPGGSVTASVSGCGSDAVPVTVLVDPAGVVFDAVTNAPVSGATVALTDVSGAGNGGRPGSAATVFAYDGVTSAPSAVTTGADGRYAFPNVASGRYRLVVTMPAGYTGPSRVGPNALPTGRVIDASGSYGGSFNVAQTLVAIDYPADPVAVAGLFVEKKASRAVADIGDFVDYQVTVRNTSLATMGNVVAHDRLPRGFAYQKGTARLNGAETNEPQAAPLLDFAVGVLAPGAQAVVSYRLRIGPGAKGGDGVNEATASSGLSQSNVARAKVTMADGGVFTDRGYLIGKVFADCNGNGLQDAGERGIADIRVVLEDGTSAVTDEDGKYSLYGLLPRTHVAKVDASTLGPTMKLVAIDSRNAGDGASRFVDLKNGELQRADFAVGGCGPALDREIDERRARAIRGGESVAAAQALLSAVRATTVDARTLPSSGIVDARGPTARGLVGDPMPTAAPAERAVPAMAPVASVPASLAERLPTLTAALGFIDLADDDVVASRRATIRVKGPAGARIGLAVDGRRVDERLVGERSVLDSAGVAAIAFVGVELAPGVNRLELTAEDAFGNVRERSTIAVRVAGDLARIVIEAPVDAKADGRSTTAVTIRLFDAAGVPIRSRTTVTLDATAGQWLARDLDPREPGTQVFVDDGVLVTDLAAPADPGRATLRARNGAIVAESRIVFVPDLRPLMAVGLVEGVFNFRSLGANSIVGSQGGDAFEREIRNVTRQFDDGRASVAARGALYLKGKVLGSTLLTLAYDSDKPQRERLFRDIQPDQFYPVYGDSSVKGFDAQSTSRLYVRVDHGTSYALYGDFSTQTDDPARALTKYDRALTGAKTRIEEGPLRVDGFAAYTSSRQVVDEIPGNGTSGPFTLSRANGVVDSEQVHVLTRDRNQPAVIVKDVPLARFADYEIEAYTGRLLFKAPIPSVDADLNPVSIRVTYEVDDGGPKFWVGGVDAKLAVTERATVGATYIRDTDPTNRSTLRGVNGTVRLAEKAVLVGEFAESDSDLYGLGKGRRVEYRQEDETVQARLYAGRTDVSFVNPVALLSQGRSEYGGKIGLRLDDRDRISIEGVRTADLASGGRREGVLARIERSFDGNVKVELGVRQADETLAPAQATSAGATPIHFTSVRTKVTVPVPGLVDASVYAEYERAVAGSDGQIAALGGSYALPSGGRLYARHEFISSLSGAYDLNPTQRLTTTVIGVDADYMKDGHVFNEYRVGGGIDARSAEAAIGLRNLWRIADGVNVTTTAENIKPVGGTTSASTNVSNATPASTRSTAVTGAIDYTAAQDWKGSARAEYRNAAIADSWLLTAGAAYRLADSTTLLAKAIWSDLGASATTGGRRLARAQFGAAYRPVDSNVWNALARIEFKREQDGTIVDSPLDETATIASMHVNVSPVPDLSFNARYGIKRATDRTGGVPSRATTQMLGGRAIKDLDDRWDVGVSAFVLASQGIRSRTYALGAEAGYRVATNLWVSAGYNVSGFKDRDLSGEEYTQRGAYLRMRYKFDENVFGGAKKDGP